MGVKLVNYSFRRRGRSTFSAVMPTLAMRLSFELGDLRLEPKREDPSPKRVLAAPHRNGRFVPMHPMGPQRFEDALLGLFGIELGK